MRGRTRTLLILLGCVGAAALVAWNGIAPRMKAQRVLAQQTEASAEPVVDVIHPQREVHGEELVLPGNIQAYKDAALYARTNGYLRRWYFDIGSHVKSGQLLAEIESPETDQQLEQAREELRTAQANQKLAEITAKRYVDLLAKDSVAKQDVDNAVQNAAARDTVVKSAEANVRRMEQLVGFEKLYAPFDGVVTARNTDVGQLIAAGPGANPSRELFHIGAISRLRVFTNVPQRYSHEMKTGMHPELTLAEMPGRRFTGTLARTSNALDATSRTLLVEIDVENRQGLLLPNAYTEVHFQLSAQAQTLTIPTASLIFRSEGLRVAVVDAAHKVALTPVQVGRDFGRTVEVLQGLNEGSAVVNDPPDSLVDGELVRLQTK